MSQYNIIASDDESTVVAEYNATTESEDSYQSEADLEREFIEDLKNQGYEYINIANEKELIANLRSQLEKLNDYLFTDNEWNLFFAKCISGANDGIIEKTRRIQTDHIQILKRDDGSTKNIFLMDKKDIHNNHLQVINQYEEANGTYKSRYDVTILVNGLPLVHVELKRRGVAIREAFNQINRYQRDSFWALFGLFQYVQIFVISNGISTKYYSNTTRNQHIKEKNQGVNVSKKKTSNSFEFTSYWADAKNKIIGDLKDFTKTFFAKHAILNILTRYSVFTSEELLLVMRPYQIAATEKILLRIKIANNYKKYGTTDAGGYIWHTTGSGKTLTSFKTAQLASGLSYIDKVIFVVDRKDLDYQTMKEYDRFEKGAANSNRSTKVLKNQLENESTKIIITTIQKLSRFVARHKEHNVYNKKIVIIFDECHRSQFGDMHDEITKAFKKYYLFGFTGTPIFAKNSSTSGSSKDKTTLQTFGCAIHGSDTENCLNENSHQSALHVYTIVNAINDKNVLPFRIYYYKTMEMSSTVKDRKVHAIDTEKALASPERISEIVKYIIEHFDQQTKRNEQRYSYEHKLIQNVAEMAASKNNTVSEKKVGTNVNGFNSILAVSNSIVTNGKRVSPVELYYNEFKRQLAECGRSLRIATIFSYSSNEEESDEDFDNAQLDKPSRDFLETAISDYNEMFNVNYDTTQDKFQNYYKDVSLRMKNREIDLLIVVNMFLTGFDATTLNTLWVDKNLKQHGLIQAFSRTNRILNSVKTFGNIVCFRNLKDATDEALSLFGDPEAGGIALLKTYGDYYNGYDEKGIHKFGYKELIDKLTVAFPLGVSITSESQEKDFIKLFGAILRLKNILTSFDMFVGNEILSIRDFQNYQSIYIDLYQTLNKKTNAEKENINDDIIFEIELIKQVEVNIDYILMLVSMYHRENCCNKEILVDIQKAVDSSIELRSKKELIENFISQINTVNDIEGEWITFVKNQKEQELDVIIKEENLKSVETHQFIDNAFNDEELKTTGTDIDKILPPVSRFSKSANRTAIKHRVINKLQLLFDKYRGLQ